MAGPTHSFDPAASPDRAPHGAALAVAPPDARAPLGEALAHVGYAPAYVDDPYALVLELSRRPLAFRAVVLSLAALYPAELRVIETIKARFGHVETIVTDADGRAAALAEAVRLGADALLEHGRLHRLAPSVPAGGQPEPRPPARPQTPRHRPLEPPESGAVLSPEEIRALLEEPPAPST